MSGSREQGPVTGRAGVRIAVRGTGSIGMQHAAAVRAAGAEPILVPMRPERQSELARAGFLTAPSLAAAREAGAAAAIIATDTARHPFDAREALQLGMDILVEKPLGATLEAIGSLSDDAKRLGRRGVVGCVLRCDPGLAGFRARLPALGAVHRVQAVCASYLPDWRPQRDYRQAYSAKADQGGVLRDLIHEIDYACWCFGWPASVMARLSQEGRLGIEAEESAELWWHVEGADVTITLDYLTKPTQRFLIAWGAHGTLRWDFITQQLEWRPAGGAPIIEAFSSSKESRLAEEDRVFLRLVSGGSGEPLPDVAEGAAAVAICDAARDASQQRRWVEVEPALKAV